MQSKQEDLDISVRQLTSMMRDKMTPDRCAHMHEELKKTTKREIMEDLKKGAKGWGRTALFVLKILMYVSLIFGGAATGAQMTGLLRIF
jgi:hypothetical protein